MRKFLVVLCLSLLSASSMAAEELPLVAGLKALDAPMKTFVRETAKGGQANFDLLDKAVAEADKAWKSAMTDSLDVERYGIAEARQDEFRRNVRLLDMLVGYMGDAHRRGDQGLVLRAVGRMPEPYGKLVEALGLR